MAREGTTNMNNEVREGGCQCGAVRYRTTGAPARTMACHCETCRRRTGSVFAVNVYFAEEDVEFVQGEMRTFEYHSSTSGRWVRNEFCIQCGTAVTWTLEMRPGVRGLASGCFDDHHWFKVTDHIWTEAAREDMRYAEHVNVHPGALPVPPE